MDLPSQIRTALSAQGLPPPSTAWLQSLASVRAPPPPLASLVATARARLLAADLTTPGLLDAEYVRNAASVLPPDGDGQSGNGRAARIRETRLSADLVVQVLDVENLSTGLWTQIEELEAVERGEMRVGRQIVRLPVGGDDGEGESSAPLAGRGAAGRGASAANTATMAAGRAASGPNATHRLVLQDCRGQKVFGLELKRIPGFGVDMLHIGAKLCIKEGAVVARGTILLEPANCIMLGGKVDAWHKAWTDGRLARLRGQIGAGIERRPQ